MAASSSLDRKRLRKEARKETGRRKAEHFQMRSQRRKMQNDQPSKDRKDGLKKIKEPVQTKSTAAKVVKPIKKRQIPSSSFIFDDQDALLAYAERAIDLGILGSDGEFDQSKMDNLFDEDSDNAVEDGEGYDMIDYGSDEEDMDSDDEDDGVSEEEALEANNTGGVSTIKEGSKQADLYGDQSVVASKDHLSHVKDERVNRQVKGLINRVTMSNFDGICGSIFKLTQDNARRVVTDQVSLCILDALQTQGNLMDSFVMTYAAVVAALGHLLDVFFVGRLLEDCVAKMDALMDEADDQVDSSPSDGNSDAWEDSDFKVTPQKVIHNCSTFLAYLYDLRIISHNIISGLVTEAASRMCDSQSKQSSLRREHAVEMIVRLIRLCGAQIRRDDPVELKKLLDAVCEAAASSVISESQRSSRFKFMLEAIDDLKCNKQKLVAINTAGGDLDNAKRTIRTLLVNCKTAKADPLTLSLEDLRNAKTRGRWWEVGGVWKPSSSSSATTATAAVSNASNENAQTAIVSETSKEMDVLSRQHGMNTDVRRAVFQAIMGSEDFVDAHHRLVALRLASKQEREIVHVLLHCLRQEKTYNPFYSLVAARFLETERNFGVTLRYALWDFITSMEENKDVEDDGISLREVAHLARFFGLLLSRQLVPLIILKRVSFAQPQANVVAFLQILFVTVFERLFSQQKSSSNALHEARDEARSIFAQIATCRRRRRRRRRSSKEEEDLFEDRSDDEESNDEARHMREMEMHTLSGHLRLFLRMFVVDQIDDLPLVKNADAVRFLASSMSEYLGTD